MSVLHEQGLEIVGVEESIILSQRRVMAIWQISPHITEEIDLERLPVAFWAGIRTAAQGTNNTELEEISSSIAFSLASMERHLLALSNEYHRELTAALERGAKPGDRFANVDTFDLWLAIHAFLLAAGSARDYLAQALAEFVFYSDIRKTGKKLPTLWHGYWIKGRITTISIHTILVEKS